MRWKLLYEGDERTFALIFQTGDEVISGLNAFAREMNLRASRLTAIGAFSDAVLGFFEWETKRYKPIPVREQVEVLSLTGDVAIGKEGPVVHAHVVVGKADGTAHGGHLMEARVRPTLEVILTEEPAHLRRRLDRESGLPLIDPAE